MVFVPISDIIQLVSYNYYSVHDMIIFQGPRKMIGNNAKLITIIGLIPFYNTHN